MRRPADQRRPAYHLVVRSPTSSGPFGPCASGWDRRALTGVDSLWAVESELKRREGEVLLWTDGACSGNPGPGGWAAIIAWPDGETEELSGHDPDTTNNRMEFTAAIEGLRVLPDGTRVQIVTDSRLLIDSMTKWLAGWKRKNWKTAAGKPVKNQDLVLALEEQIAKHEVRWHWVRGHQTGAQHAYKALNDRADQLAVAASRDAVAT